ncbi:MAG: polymer-forming cytoskeletal protein [Acidobacteria bacterium]|nr:polymer-forming cytoskeletal protein [Acidobacteriota bacterium]
MSRGSPAPVETVHYGPPRSCRCGFSRRNRPRGSRGRLSARGPRAFPRRDPRNRSPANPATDGGNDPDPGGLVVESGARIDAEIETDHATLRGPAAGTLSAAGWVRVDPTGEFRGEIRALRLRIEPGAILNGRVQVPDPD